MSTSVPTPKYEFVQGDTLPAVQETLYYSDGTTADLTGATVRFHMTPVGSSTPKVNAPATIASDPTTGVVTYTWVGTDLDTVGYFDCEWEEKCKLM